MDDLTRRWARLSLHSTEQKLVNLTPEIESNNKVLVAKLFTKRRVNVEALSRTLRSMWRSIQNFEVRDLGLNTVLILFDNETDPMKILAQGPWSFDKYLIGLYKPKEEESVDDATFTNASFWMQIHGLPLRRMNRANAEAIRTTLGTLEQVDVSSTGECHGRYIRVRVNIDISKPLCRGRFVNVGDQDPQWISFQYERLPIYCYECGLLNHDERDCQLLTDNSDTSSTDNQQYGPWLRATMTNIQQPQLVTNKTPPSTKPPRTPRPTPLPQHIPPYPPPQYASPCPPPQNTPPSPPPKQPTFLTNTPTPPPHKATPTPETETPQFPVNHNDAPNSTDILSNPNLFNCHINVIDQELNTPPTRNSGGTIPDVTQNDNVIHPHSLPLITPNKATPEHMHNSKNHSFNHSNIKPGIGGVCYAAPPDIMSILNWNCRGLGNPRTVNALLRALDKEDPICVFLMETKLTTDQLNAKKQGCAYNQGIAVSSKGSSGGLALLWKSDAKVHIKKISRWFIDAHVVCKTTGLTWRLTGFYGQPDTSKREETWTLLESLGRYNTLPWLCVGDYNEIVKRSEKLGGALRPARQMDRFHTVIHHCRFLDLGYIGSHFTWSRNHPIEGRIHIRLDRALATIGWCSLFPGTTVHHIPMSTSDHSLLSIRFRPPIASPRPLGRLFRFEAMWLRDPRCAEVVQDAWQDGLFKPDDAQITNCLDSCRERLTT
ncbi:uncharacterized protein LOC142644317 [Castanea sativa]|uniref:uncharacterized protein LOC142644317 n=1 Tax=Castanea sativa TaxID=21020 RepID=UPI003F64BF44